MTAEIGVLNPLGIALAADSAVTAGPNNVFQSADKLFQLSDNAPVALMIYGEATLLGAPWEMIVKLYRARLGAATFDSLEDYAVDFLDYVAESKVFSRDAQSDHVFREALRIFSSLRETFISEGVQPLSEKGTFTLREVQAALLDAIRKTLEAMRTWDMVEDLPGNYSNLVARRYAKEIRKAKKAIFEEYPLSQQASRLLTSLVVEFLRRRRPLMIPGTTGIVFAGFGEAEFFPALLEYRVQGVAAGSVLFSPANSVAVGPGLVRSAIVPFAQEEMVRTFLDGMDPALADYVYGMLEQVIEEVGKTVESEIRRHDKKLANDLSPNLQKGLTELAGAFKASVRDECRASFANPVLDVLHALTKEELAAVAEAFVNLTKFKRRVSTQAESVGGPVDVAVITKGDGFVWVKRKHYFPAELNPRAMARFQGRH